MAYTIRVTGQICHIYIYIYIYTTKLHEPPHPHSRLEKRINQVNKLFTKQKECRCSIPPSISSSRCQHQVLEDPFVKTPSHTDCAWVRLRAVHLGWVDMYVNYRTWLRVIIIPSIHCPDVPHLPFLSHDSPPPHLLIQYWRHFIICLVVGVLLPGNI